MWVLSFDPSESNLKDASLDRRQVVHNIQLLTVFQVSKLFLQRLLHAYLYIIPLCTITRGCLCSVRHMEFVRES